MIHDVWRPMFEAEAAFLLRLITYYIARAWSPSRYAYSAFATAI